MQNELIRYTIMVSSDYHWSPLLFYSNVVDLSMDAQDNSALTRLA